MNNTNDSNVERPTAKVLPTENRYYIESRSSLPTGDVRYSIIDKMTRQPVTVFGKALDYLENYGNAEVICDTYNDLHKQGVI